MSDELNSPSPLQYEGVTSLIITQFRDMKDEQLRQFNVLKAYNEKQNGNVAKIFERVVELEKVNAGKESNCIQKGAVRKLQDNQITQEAVKKYIGKTVGITGGVMTILWIAFQIISNI